VPDWPGHGRSGLKDPAGITGELVCEALADLVNSLGTPVVLVTHSMGGAFGWRIAELAGDRVAAIVGIAPAAPGNIQPAGEVLEEDADGWVIRTPLRTGRVRRGGAVSVDRVFVEGKLIGRSTQFPLEHGDSYVASLTGTASRLLFERQNVDQSQVRVRNPACLSGKPILIVTPTEDIDHPRAVDEGVAQWLVEQGAKAEFVWLGDRGLVGNGHMVMLERKSEAVADLVLDWMDHLPGRDDSASAPTNLTAFQS